MANAGDVLDMAQLGCKVQLIRTANRVAADSPASARGRELIDARVRLLAHARDGSALTPCG